MVSFGQWGKFGLLSLVALAISIISGYLLATRFNFDPLSTISAIFTAGILLVSLYSATSDGGQPTLEQQREDSTDSGENSSETSEESEESTSRTIGPSAGLRAEQRQIQNELIRIAYREFEQRPFSFMVGYRAPSLVEEVAENTNSSQDDVFQVWQFCKDDGYFRNRGNAWRITPKAVFRADELGEEVHLDDEIQDAILNTLLQEYRDDPLRARVSQDSILESFSQSWEKLMQNLWYLEQKDFVERTPFGGGNPVYEITSLGRNVIE